ncbi:MAG: IS200/IS605 family transposase [Deltaproteobacteria bacterium]|nr:IS200/IS605 family transposase [Deltaproteobacteria bacterium]
MRRCCRYHVVFVPKYRKNTIFGQLQRGIGKILRDSCTQYGVDLVEGHALADHVHLCLSILPRFSVTKTVGFLKGKPASRIHRESLGRRSNFRGYHFFACDYCVSTVGLDEQKARKYIRNQDAEQRRQVQLGLGDPGPLH